MTVAPDPLRKLAAFTPARIALGRVGASLPTREVLNFALAHARARDAVHAPFDIAAVETQIRALGLSTVCVASAAESRSDYLRRPDLGRRLHDTSIDDLQRLNHPLCDLAIVVTDGLSSAAIHLQVAPFLDAFKRHADARGLRLAPVVIARLGRVALGDDIGARLKARAVAVLIGERPGLSSPDSLGVYLTIAPAPGRTDAERNCISNIRPEGLSHERAAFKLDWLMGEALRRGITGVGLKDESDLVTLASPAKPVLSGP
ncbi:ethanolamine ammonia-lyase subunit EutC [Reyranella sp. CPCC 100927]|uniref:ethanolamine ammonia-lyase subunit EutC n=1 Tax=Reyranella sp. CPCC 100927 TaxID=2599616 RepID=UPI0011B3F34D|nr:ethanolamine ammonia-lyase subunit EutC [Reyranella sp. CPCC 100927]TWT12764.1 ethanolamine ammonia-lyase subunit EutC [Reyranella sp. CPCC 100927]